MSLDTQTATDSVAPRGRARWFGWAVVALVMLIATVVLGWTPLANPSPGGFSDSIDYIAFAEFFRDWFAGERSPQALAFFQHTRFPPLFPLAIMAAGGGLQATQPAYWLTAIPAILSVALAIAWIARETRDPLAAALIALPFALSPTYFVLTLNPVSEPLFVCLLMLGLLLAPRIAASRTSLLAFALCAGAIPLCRTAGLALTLAAAVQIARTTSRPLWQRAGAIALLALPIALWQAYRSTLPINISYDEQFSIARSLEVFGGWYGWLVEHPVRIVGAYGATLHPLHGKITFAVGCMLIGLAFVGWARRIRALAPDAIVIFLYLGLVFLWPFPAEVPRLIVVTLPIVWLCAWQGLEMIVDALRARPGLLRTRASAAFLAMIALALLAPFGLRAVERASRPVDPDLEPFKRNRSLFMMEDDARAFGTLELSAKIKAAMEELPAYVPAGECVNTFQTQMAWFYTNGRVKLVPTTYPADETKPVRQRFGGCRYVFVMLTTSPQFGQPALYPMIEIAGHSDILFMSTIETPGKRVPATALFEFRDDAPTTIRAPAVPTDDATTKGDATGNATPESTPPH